MRSYHQWMLMLPMRYIDRWRCAFYWKFIFWHRKREDLLIDIKKRKEKRFEFSESKSWFVWPGKINVIVWLGVANPIFCLLYFLSLCRCQWRPKLKSTHRAPPNCSVGRDTTRQNATLDLRYLYCPLKKVNPYEIWLSYLE